MYALMVVLAGGGLWLLYVLGSRYKRRARRQRALRAPFPREWDEILRSNLPPYEKLPPALQQELQQDIKVFIAEKSFEGCGGLTMTDEIKLTIAGQACMLLLNRDDDCYPKLFSILVYPSTYVAGGEGLFGGQSDPESVRLGESWGHGSVVLSWCSVRQGAFNFSDGHNVTMHEFAHQLDQEDGEADGAPILDRRSAYSSWARVFSSEFDKLKKNSHKRRAVLDSYGTTNPAEFFAVATESFFEKPEQLREKHPELYEQLSDYYRVNPTEWV